MRTRIWVICLAATSTLVCFTAWGGLAYQGYKAQHDQIRRQAAIADVPKPQSPRSLTCKVVDEADINCTIQGPDAEGTDEYTKSDLQVQQESAEWAFLSMLFGGVALFFTVITTAGLLYSLYLTRRALLDTREIGQVQTRAYLQIEFGNLNYQSTSMGQAGITLGGNIANLGQSPAKNALVGGLLSKSDPHPIKDHIGRITFSKISSFIAPTYRLNDIRVTMPFDDHHILATDSDPLWYAIVVKFEDEFGKYQESVIKGTFIRPNGTPMPINEIESACLTGNISLVHK